MENKANSSAMDRLQQMAGLDNIKKQFERYRDAFKRYRDGKTPGKFHQHMAFMGNPGTGKTTVARLFAEILHEDGLLTKGQFVGVSPIDLISPYVGQTISQTQAVCDRAKGGVLFIDEAYALMSGANDNGNVDFGKEAIEVLIQFMMNNDDTVVIFAGYTDEMKRFINECNPGFRSHLFNDSLSFFYFEDYEPDVLYQIAKKNIPDDIKTTEAFDQALRNIIVLKHAYRTKSFGNARDMENLANTIVSAYQDANDPDNLDVKHLPERLRILVDSTMLNKQTMLAELNQIVGQVNVKKIVEDLYVRCLAERQNMFNTEDHTLKLQRLNYVFLGNPGTGKTTVARIIGNLLQKMGVLSSNDASVLTEVSGGDVVQMTRAQIQRLFEDNIGKVLFIDEAYMLSHNPQAIGEIVCNVTNPDYQNKMCVILVGYTTEMHQLMRFNPGMFSRFEEVLFQDYTNKELWEILKRKISAPGSQLRMDVKTCEQEALNYFASLPRGPHFGNAREVDALILILRSNLNKRYVQATEEQRKDPNFAMIILPEDFPPTNCGGEDLDLTPEERLNKMQGIDNIRGQFNRYRKAFKRYLNGEGDNRFRPHMVFMGNPGTGKTTVARLFAEILHEEGLLPQGQFVEATPADLIGQYIGQTRVKAGALCDRAKGGVLFIDEAYGLMSGVNDNGNADFGKEAIEVLLQFMENSDSLVILAGYPEETMRLINEGNPGFKSRFDESLGFFHFEDYEHQEDGNIDVDCIPEQNRIPEVNKEQLKEELMLLANELQEKLQQLQSKLNELSEE